MVVILPDGSRADLSDFSVDSTDPRLTRVGLKDRGAGTYTVSWEVISADDGHFSKGAYVFFVGQSGPNTHNEASGFQTLHSSSVPEAFTLAIEVIGNALMLGALIVLVFLWRPARQSLSGIHGYEHEFAHRFWLVLSLGCFLSLAGGAAYLLRKTWELSSFENIALLGAWNAFITTTSARFTIYRMLGVVFLSVVFAIARKQLLSIAGTPRLEWGLFAGLAFVDLARARVSHAAASSFAPSFSVSMNFIHLLFKEAWIGGVIALVVIFSPLASKSRDLRMAGFALIGFSKIASIALGVAGVTGVYVVWLHLKSFSNVLMTDWGKRFAVLSLLALFLILLRLFHQLYVEPRIVRAIKQGDEKQALGIWGLRFTLPAEMAIGIAILAVTSILIITTPPISFHQRFLRSAHSESLELLLERQPYESDKFLVTAQPTPGNNEVNRVENMVVTLTNQAAGIGPLLAPAEERFSGGYVFDGRLLAPPGRWTVNITAQRRGAYDAVASFPVIYPEEILESDTHAGDRTFGSFELLHIAAALVILAASVILYRESSKRYQFLLAVSDGAPASRAVHFSHPAAWVPVTVLIATVLYLAGALPFRYYGVLESPFERACENANVMNVWHEAVPQRAGEATGDLAFPGCTTGTGLGQYHFVDAREFAYFERPARARAQLATSPTELTPNVPILLTFRLRDYQGHPVQDLALDHNRILHVIIASEDFSVFSHIHAEDLGPITPQMLKTSQFPVHYIFPKSGRYLVSADFMERGYYFSNQFYLNVGSPGTMSAPAGDGFSVQENAGGYLVTLKTSPATLKAGTPATLHYHIEKDRQPFLEMNPYLAVPMHITIIRDDLTDFLHIHGLLPVSLIDKLLGESIHASHLFLPNRFGPDIEATNFAFPSAGIYHIFSEFSAGGKVVVAQFTVKVK